ncbi:MAG: DNA-binding protein [Verrucomicrobiae bacterium]|nr:DNA-binding protein [Verrucomicrobiae bacterium]
MNLNRNDFQGLSDLRAKDAKALLDAGHYPGAYYLFGYAMECALKSCIAKRVKEFDFPDKKFSNECWTHDLQKLVSLAGLKSDLDAAVAADPGLGANWSLVKELLRRL